MADNTFKKKKQKRKYKRKKLKFSKSPSNTLKIRCKKLQRKDRKFKIRLLALLFLSFTMMAFILVHNYIKLNNIRNEYNNLQSQYTSYQLTRDRLNSELDRAVDLKEIQRYAMENLDMVYENKDNIVYLNIDR